MSAVNKLRNNGTLMHNHFADDQYSQCRDSSCGGQDNGMRVEDTATGMLLQPINGSPSATMPVVVSYRPGAPTRTSIPLRTCYCQSNRNKTLLIILTVAILVLGTTIGALIMYFTGDMQCSITRGKCFDI